MAERQVTVRLKLDFTGLAEAMRRCGDAIRLITPGFASALRLLSQERRTETPARSAMHASYRRRQMARRKRGRR